MSDKIYLLPERSITIVISDLHIGGGETDPGDDHIFHGNSFIRFLKELPSLVNGQARDILLVINGDFLEFAQTAPEKYDDSIAYGHWCCEQESLDKLQVIIDGNQQIWAAMKTFQQLGGCILIAVGNHDIDFTWAKVRSAFTAVAGDAVRNDPEDNSSISDSLIYALGQDWLSSYGGKLLITHGNQFDSANKFENWHDPIVVGLGPDRLEMCAGTMFMVKFVNQMEKEYPFADNITPITRLYYILRDQDPEGFRELRWLLGLFLVKHPGHSIGTDKDKSGYQLDRLFALYHIDQKYKDFIDLTVSQYLTKEPLPPAWQQNIDTFNNVIIRLISNMPKDQFASIFRKEFGSVGIVKAGLAKDVEILRDAAKSALFKFNGQIAVMGHTHQPDECNFGKKQYFNPGSWTRYWDVSKQQNLTLDELKNESSFPYKLYYIEVKQNATGDIVGKKVLFEKDGKKTAI